ncbi:Hypothetical predicted protein [Marmota monax]|uniref:Uncharacterized protein n=1 Tax=Marmota monax TaxID=9995 RepID=A0A5E4CSP6_MARMO|nr:Hypothetical predicted protein [Marmota monax]
MKTRLSFKTHPRAELVYKSFLGPEETHRGEEGGKRTKPTAYQGQDKTQTKEPLGVTGRLTRQTPQIPTAEPRRPLQFSTCLEVMETSQDAGEKPLKYIPGHQRVQGSNQPKGGTQKQEVERSPQAQSQGGLGKQGPPEDPRANTWGAQIPRPAAASPQATLRTFEVRGELSVPKMQWRSPSTEA